MNIREGRSLRYWLVCLDHQYLNILYPYASTWHPLWISWSTFLSKWIIGHCINWPYHIYNLTAYLSVLFPYGFETFFRAVPHNLTFWASQCFHFCISMSCCWYRNMKNFLIQCCNIMTKHLIPHSLLPLTFTGAVNPCKTYRLPKPTNIFTIFNITHHILIVFFNLQIYINISYVTI